MKKLIRTGIAGLLALSLCGCSAMVQIAKIPGGDRGETEGNGSIFTDKLIHIRIDQPYHYN